MKGFALGLALKQRRNATRKSSIEQLSTHIPYHVLTLKILHGEKTEDNQGGPRGFLALGGAI